MGTIALESIVILLLILASGALAMSEIAVVSARRARLKQRAEEGDSSAAAALELARAPDRFLSTVQIGITLVGVLAGAFGGATLAEQIEDALRSYPPLAAYAEVLGVGAVVAAVTYLSLILGELVPKRIALNDPERIASLVAPSMRRLARIASPAVRFLTVSAAGVLRLLRVRPSSDPAVTEDEIRILIEQGTAEGTFEVKERDIVSRVLRLGDRPVAAVMTPRSDVVWIDLEDDREKILETLRESGRSQLPVAEGDLDQVRGVVRVVDWLRSESDEPRKGVTAAMRPATFVPENSDALDLLERFQEYGQHIAVVLDEHGGVSGVVTLHDLLEAMVGDLPHADEPSEPPAVQREDGSWLVDGSLGIEDFKDLFRVRSLNEEKEGSFHTVSGLVMAALRRVPHSGDSFDTSGLSVEVLDMDGNRVDKVLVTPPKEEA